jgi:hypothetical protein
MEVVIEVGVVAEDIPVGHSHSCLMQSVVTVVMVVRFRSDPMVKSLYCVVTVSAESRLVTRGNRVIVTPSEASADEMIAVLAALRLAGLTIALVARI